jgi:hypothetical protein
MTYVQGGIWRTKEAGLVFENNVREGIKDSAWKDASRKLQMFWLAVPGPDIKKFCMNRGNQMTIQAVLPTGLATQTW